MEVPACLFSQNNIICMLSTEPVELQILLVLSFNYIRAIESKL